MSLRMKGSEEKESSYVKGRESSAETEKSGEGMNDLESEELVIYGGKLAWIELCMSGSSQWTPVILSALVCGEDTMLPLRNL